MQDLQMRSIKRVIRARRRNADKRETICDAIQQMRPIEFFYRGGYRTVEPFALGIVLTDRADNESLLCWQTRGLSELLEVQGWKLYRVSDMSEMVILNEHFTGDRPGYDPDNLEMAEVICCVRLAKKAEEPVEPAPAPKLTLESSPIPPYVPPPRAPEPEPIIRYITHNELMERFRYAHPLPIPELDTTLWPEPLAIPFPERDTTRVLERAQTPVIDITRYLVGEPA